MSRRIAHALAALLMGTLATTIAVGSPAQASAKPVGDCTTTSGVILAVDFGHWGGPVLRACGTTPTTGFTLLNEGGWHTTGTGHDGPAFICRIGYDGYHGGTQYPTSKDESCVLTPPASAYWSYWHADPGQNTWSYSQLGAMSYRPKPGSVDLWNFGGTNIAGTTGSGIPTISPNSLRAHNTTPISGTHPKPTATAKHTVTTTPTTPGARPAATATHGGTASPTRSTAQGPGGLTISGARSPSSSDIVDAPAIAARHASRGSTTPAIVALVIVVLLAAAGIVAVLRRPRREQSDQ